jgi:hypothetical protein
MVNKSRNLKIAIAFLFSTILFSQSKTIVPRSGTIVFAKETKVTDNLAFKKSIKEFKPRFFDAIKKGIVYERLQSGVETDSVQLESSIKMLEYLFDQNFEETLKTMIEKTTIFHNYTYDKIYSYQFQNGKESSQMFYDKKSGKVYDKIDTKIIEGFYNEATLEIKEYRDEIKMINNYKCFKIVYTYIVTLEDYSFSDGIFKVKRELWVTEAIKSPFISFIKEQKLCKSYFPLEIIEYFVEIEGFETKYTLEKLAIK